MARKPRFTLPGYTQHVVQRGNNRQACFFAESDYRKYLASLAEAAKKYACQVHAYVLMTNHVHLLVTPATSRGIAQMMQSIGRRYVRHVNAEYGRTGTLWEGRYRAGLVQSDGHLLTCHRYIELNPLRAGMIPSPVNYPWSSYRANALGTQDPVITHHAVYQSLGSTPENRQRAYENLFQYDIDNDVLWQVRQALNQELVFGTERFKDRIEALLRRRVRQGQPGRPRNS